MKAIHNKNDVQNLKIYVVLYLKDTEKWKQFTTNIASHWSEVKLCCISKILKNESNSQQKLYTKNEDIGCVVSQRYWKMKAIHNEAILMFIR